MIKYREEQTFHPLLLSLLIFPILIIAALYSQLPKKELANYSIAIIEVFLIFILVNFYKLKIIITDEYLQFGFGLFKKKISRNKIISCRPFDVKFGQYFGIGIRYGWLNNTILYNTWFKPGVRIKVKGSKRDYVITTDNSKKICNILRR